MTRNLPLRERTHPLRRRALAGMCFLALTLTAPLTADAAAIAAADHQEGYAGVVLGKLCEIWTPPADTGSRMMRVRISVNGDGSVLGCTPTQRSGVPALDNSVCEAAKKLGKLETPPYAMPIDVHLAFWSGTPRRAPAQQGTITVSPSEQAVVQTAAPAAPAPVRTDAQPELRVSLTREELTAIIDGALERQLAPLRRELAARSEEGPRLQDVVGGLGWIMGLVGMGLYFARRRP